MNQIINDWLRQFISLNMVDHHIDFKKLKMESKADIIDALCKKQIEHWKNIDKNKIELRLSRSVCTLDGVDYILNLNQFVLTYCYATQRGGTDVTEPSNYIEDMMAKLSIITSDENITLDEDVLEGLFHRPFKVNIIDSEIKVVNEYNLPKNMIDDKNMFTKLMINLKNQIVSIFKSMEKSIKQSKDKVAIYKPETYSTHNKELTDEAKTMLVKDLSPLMLSINSDKINDSSINNVANYVENSTTGVIFKSAKDFVLGKTTDLNLLLDSSRNQVWSNLNKTDGVVTKIINNSKVGFVKSSLGKKAKPIVIQQVVGVTSSGLKALMVYYNEGIMTGKIVKIGANKKAELRMFNNISDVKMETILRLIKSVRKLEENVRSELASHNDLIKTLENMSLKNDGSKEHKDRVIFITKIIPLISKTIIERQRTVIRLYEVANNLARVYLKKKEK